MIVSEDNIMFIRFVTGEVDGDSHVSTGLFTAAFELMYETDDFSDAEYFILRGLMDWFNVNLKGPFGSRLRAAGRAGRAICWFKPTAHEHLSRAWEMVSILERNDVVVRTIKVERPGYVLYEDEAQILAEPFADIRRVL